MLYRSSLKRVMIFEISEDEHPEIVYIQEIVSVPSELLSTKSTTYAQPWILMFGFQWYADQWMEETYSKVKNTVRIKPENGEINAHYAPQLSSDRIHQQNPLRVYRRY